MPHFLLTWLVTAISLMLTADIVPGFIIKSFSAAAIAAIVLGLVNAIVKPLLVILTLPLTIVTLGLFLFVINALTIWLAGALTLGFDVDGFVPALLGSIVLLTAPGADDLVRDAAAAILARSGAKVTLIKDSPGFVAQRMCAMIANLGCEMAMIGIASAADVDTAMTLGLNYPRGPLALADWLGVRDCHEMLVQLQAITGDDRYRPSQWLRRRAQLGLSATTLD